MAPRFKRQRETDEPAKTTIPNSNNISTYFLKLIKDNDLIKNNGKPLKNNGRKAKLTPAMQENILQAVELGMPVEPACHLVGITTMTYYNWLKWGLEENREITESLDFAIEKLIETDQLEKDPVQLEEFIDVFVKAKQPSKFFYFFYAIEQAKAQGHIKALASIRQAAEGGRYLSETRIVKDKKGNVTGEIDVTKYMKPDWNAGAWYLERKFPDLYGQKIKQEGTIDHQHDHTVKHEVAIPESVDRAAGILGILLGSGFVQKRLVGYSEGELPASQQIIEAETD